MASSSRARNRHRRRARRRGDSGRRDGRSARACSSWVRTAEPLQRMGARRRDAARAQSRAAFRSSCATERIVRCTKSTNRFARVRAMVSTGSRSAAPVSGAARPGAARGEIRLRIEACGVCRTDLHVVDRELPDTSSEIIPGHESWVSSMRSARTCRDFSVGDRVGVPWLGSTCGRCEYCLASRENLCDAPTFTGYTRPGGFASHIVARAAYCVPLSRAADAVATAPLLCAGLIGWRCLQKTGAARRIGLYGFGAAAHIVAQIARWQRREVFAFTRAGDIRTQAFARSLGRPGLARRAMRRPSRSTPRSFSPRLDRSS